MLIDTTTKIRINIHFFDPYLPAEYFLSCESSVEARASIDYFFLHRKLCIFGSTSAAIFGLKPSALE